MPKNKFGNRFSQDDFLAAMPEETLITSAGIASRVGCSHETARDRLAQLETAEKVRRVEIIDGRDAVWQKV